MSHTKQVEKVNRLVPKSIQAYRWSVAKLNLHAKLNHEKLYFWTFTFVQKMPEFRYSYAWQGFIRDVGAMYRNEVPLYGIKVTEHHKTHGLHYHCVVNKRLPVGALRRIGKRYGVGWMKVRIVNDVDGVGKYLEKYMCKEFGEKFLPGIRRWSCLGGFGGVAVNSIRMDTPASRALKLFSSLVYDGEKIPFKDMLTITRSQNIHAPEHLATCIAWAIENKGDLTALEWSWHRLEHEANLPENPMDGRVPF